MAKKTPEVKVEKEVEATVIKVEPLTQEFTQVSELNILRDKINEIIKQL